MDLQLSAPSLVLTVCRALYNIWSALLPLALVFTPRPFVHQYALPSHGHGHSGPARLSDGRSRRSDHLTIPRSPTRMHCAASTFPCDVPPELRFSIASVAAQVLGLLPDPSRAGISPAVSTDPACPMSGVIAPAAAHPPAKAATVRRCPKSGGLASERVVISTARLRPTTKPSTAMLDPN